MIIQLQKTHMKLCHHMLEIVHLQDTCIYCTYHVHDIYYIYLSSTQKALYRYSVKL